MKILIKNDAYIHKNNEYMLIYIGFNGHIKVFIYLFPKGNVIHANDDYVIRLLSENEYIDVVKFLINSDSAKQSNFMKYLI